jgi:hypothetical protein
MSNYTALDKIRELKDKKEVDLLAVIVTLFDRDDYFYELTLKDFANQAWSMCVYKQGRSLYEGECYRIRGVYLDKSSDTRRVLLAKQTTNFLRFSRHSLVAKQLIEAIEDNS